MRKHGNIFKILFVILVLTLLCFGIASYRIHENVARVWLTPLDTGDRAHWESMTVKDKGGFTDYRTAYGHMKKHLHTGVDLVDPAEKKNLGIPVYAVARGKVYDVSRRGPASRVTIRHILPDGRVVYTSYIHIADIRVREGDWVGENTIIGRTLNHGELTKWGKIFDHLHFQVHRARFVSEHTVNSKTADEVTERFYDPEWIFYHHAGNERTDWLKLLWRGKISLWDIFWLVF